MLTLTYIAAWALALTNPTFAEEPAIVARAPQAESTSVALGTASGGALDPLATRPPQVGARPVFAGGPDLTINIVNSFGSPLSIFYGSNAGAPTPVGNPGSGMLTSSTKVLFPSDWAGRITIGKNYDPLGSKIEASYSSPNYVPDVDISYVDGFSVPISCSCKSCFPSNAFPSSQYILSCESLSQEWKDSQDLSHDSNLIPKREILMP